MIHRSHDVNLDLVAISPSQYRIERKPGIKHRRAKSKAQFVNSARADARTGGQAGSDVRPTIAVYSTFWGLASFGSENSVLFFQDDDRITEPSKRRSLFECN
jgi:hypothetical protein